MLGYGGRKIDPDQQQSSRAVCITGVCEQYLWGLSTHEVLVTAGIPGSDENVIREPAAHHRQEADAEGRWEGRLWLPPAPQTLGQGRGMVVLCTVSPCTGSACLPALHTACLKSLPGHSIASGVHG